MRVLVACEFSGRVRDAFIARGHDAISCDLLPTAAPGPHIQGDVRQVKLTDYDLLIAHPTCTYICNSSVWAFHKLPKNPGKGVAYGPDRWRELEHALSFFNFFLNSGVPKICIENPIPHGYAVDGYMAVRSDTDAGWVDGIGKYSQIIQPYQFGHDASKQTCLWLRGLPKLVGTNYVQPRLVNGRKRWANQTDSGQNRLTPSEDRWALRSETYTGIAEAMAAQWG